jgi:hypothetical protein
VAFSEFGFDDLRDCRDIKVIVGVSKILNVKEKII